MLRRAQVDNLRTNHRGTFVLKDNPFRGRATLSVDPPPAPGAGAPAPVAGVSELARDYLVLPCALVRARGAGWLSWLSLRLLSLVGVPESATRYLARALVLALRKCCGDSFLHTSAEVRGYVAAA